jgi:DNA/RNA endonuclease YhcR with UshA esterase domain
LAQVGTSLSKYASSGATANFNVVVLSKVTADDGTVYSFDIVYSVDSTYSAYLAVSEDGKSILVTTPNTLEGGTDQKCAIHAAAKLNGTEYATEDFNILVKAVSKYTIKLLYSAKDGDAVTFQGIVSGLYGADYGTKGTYYTIYVGDGDFGITVFSAALPDGAAIGDYVNVAGTVSIYSGLYEIKSATLTKITAADAPAVVAPTALAISAENTPTIATNMASRSASITQGTVTSVAGTIGANITLKVKVGEVAYTVFENSTYAAAADYATFSQTRTGATEATIIEVNDIIDLSGFTSFYTTSQIVGAKITKWTEGVAPADTPITIANLTNVGWDTAVSSYVTQGFVTGYYAGIGTPKNGIFIADGDAGLDIYGYTGDCSAFPVGTCVTVVGVPSVFNGLIEFTANSIVATATADITAKAAVTAEFAGKTGLTNSVVSRYAHLTGIVAKTGTDNNNGTAPVAGTTNMNVTFTIGAGETINAYLPKWFDTTTYNAFAALAAGDMVEFNGFVANYANKVAAWSADLTSGLQIVAPSIVKVTAAASIVLATPTMTVAGAVAAAKGAAVDTIGIYQGSYSANMYQGVFFGDGANSIVTYKGAAFPIGMVKGVYLHVVGAAAPFNGLPEIDISAGSISVLPQGTVAATVLAPVANSTVSAALAAADLNHEFDITGAVIKTISKAVVAGSTDGNYVLTIGTLDVTLFVKKTALAPSVYTALAAAKVGDSLAFTAFGGQYVSNSVATYQLVAPQNVVVTAA